VRVILCIDCYLRLEDCMILSLFFLFFLVFPLCPDIPEAWHAHVDTCTKFIAGETVTLILLPINYPRQLEAIVDKSSRDLSIDRSQLVCTPCRNGRVDVD